MSAGDKLRAADPMRIVARGQRTTGSSTFTNTETAFFRLDDIPVYDGKLYWITASNMNPDTNTANDVIDVRARALFGSAAGGAAGTGDTQLGHLRVKQTEVSFSNVEPLSVLYVPAADGYLSVALTGQRVAGTGTISMAFGTGAFLDVVVFEADDPGDTGISL